MDWGHCRAEVYTQNEMECSETEEWDVTSPRMKTIWAYNWNEAVNMVPDAADHDSVWSITVIDCDAAFSADLHYVVFYFLFCSTKEAQNKPKKKKTSKIWFSPNRLVN